MQQSDAASDQHKLGKGQVWLIRAVVCVLAANRGSSCSLTRAMDGRTLRCGIISSCQSAANSEIVNSCRESDSCKRRYSKYPTYHVMDGLCVYYTRSPLCFCLTLPGGTVVPTIIAKSDEIRLDIAKIKRVTFLRDSVK